MRARTPRRLVAVALTTAIVAGSAGTALAADAPPARTVRAEAPVPGADAVLKQVKTLADLGGVLKPVTDVLTGALNGGSPADVTALAGKATSALDAVKAAAPAAPAVPAPAVAAPALPATPPAALPALPLGGPQFAAGPADIKADAVAALKKSLDSLVKAVTSANVAGIVPAATEVVTGLVGLVVATVLGGGLPVPNLPGLPALPKLPTDALPVAPPKLPA
ncbi:hypothetical protein [Streptomyces sp. NBC_00083]|uniref:hypothetical protein n=1 Tax=Streptomyces sp. NBC_00083 TaxID=2975647 RepID=UPI00225480CD|nr:hypothetical protein [Streptomyces sp. NBC_00083]MCX5381771.1 hypothetical protein [Streptomyces sp. NBC_00083]